MCVFLTNRRICLNSVPGALQLQLLHIYGSEKVVKVNFAGTSEKMMMDTFQEHVFQFIVRVNNSQISHNLSKLT